MKTEYGITERGSRVILLCDDQAHAESSAEEHAARGANVDVVRVEIVTVYLADMDA